MLDYAAGGEVTKPHLPPTRGWVGRWYEGGTTLVYVAADPVEACVKCGSPFTGTVHGHCQRCREENPTYRDPFKGDAS